MPNRKTPQSTTNSREENASEEKKESDYIEIKLPNIQSRTITSLLIFGLLVASFALGYQTAKVTYWEEKAKTLGTTNALSPNLTQPSPTPSKVEVSPGHLPPLGKNNAKVTIIEFSDMQCPFCRRFWKDTLPQLKKDYIDKGQVKFYYRHLPLPPEVHPAATPLAEASECANDQNKFWEYHDKIFAEQAEQGEGTIPITNEQIKEWAAEIGLNTAQFNECFDSGKYSQKVKDDLADAQKAGASSTPTFYINGTPLVGALPYEAFKTIIDQELKK